MRFLRPLLDLEAAGRKVCYRKGLREPDVRRGRGERDRQTIKEGCEHHLVYRGV